MKLTPRSTNLGLLAALVAVVVGIWFVVRDSEPSQAAAARTATVTRNTVTAQVSGTGNLASASSTTLNFATGGTLTKIAVKVGDVVQEGDLLATVDPADAKTALEKAQADLASARAQYEELAQGRSATDARRDQLTVRSAQLEVTSAKKALARAKEQAALDAAEQDRLVEQAEKAYKKGTGTKQQVDQAKQTRAQTRLKSEQAVEQAVEQVARAKNQLAQEQAGAAANAEGASSAELAQARATVRSAQAAVDDAEQGVDDTKLRAPSDGTVMSVNGAVGESVTVGSTSSGSTSSGSTSSGGTSGTSGGTAGSSGFLVLTDLADLQVTANVAEADIGDVEVGQAAQVTLSASGAVVPGTVTAVALEGATSNNVVQYPVTVGLDEIPDGARPGASATVVITTGSARNALSLPSSAITTAGRTHTVTLVKDGVQTVTPVEIGLEGTATTEIVSGVAEGDIVALPDSTSSGSSGIPGFGGGPGDGLGGGGLGGGLGGGGFSGGGGRP